MRGLITREITEQGSLISAGFWADWYRRERAKKRVSLDHCLVGKLTVF